MFYYRKYTGPGYCHKTSIRFEKPQRFAMFSQRGRLASDQKDPDRPAIFFEAWKSFTSN